MQFNLLVNLYDSLIMALPASTLTRNFIMLKTMAESENKSYPIILISF